MKNKNSVLALRKVLSMFPQELTPMIRSREGKLIVPESFKVDYEGDRLIIGESEMIPQPPPILPPANFELEVVVKEALAYGDKCDGCSRVLIPGEKILVGIESCCGGGCSRVLCKQCVLFAASLFQEVQ